MLTPLAPLVSNLGLAGNLVEDVCHYLTDACEKKPQRTLREAFTEAPRSRASRLHEAFDTSPRSLRVLELLMTYSQSLCEASMTCSRRAFSVDVS